VCYEDYSLQILGIISSYCEHEDIAEAIIYATDAGYHVINMSLAGPQPSAVLQNAIEYAWGQGVVIVAGAGNSYTPDKMYPAAFDEVIAVAATDRYDNLAYFSSFSSDIDDWVSVAAPGDIIFSAIPSNLCGLAPNDPDGCYDWKSGTSMATPIVAGIAAMLWSHLPAPDNIQIRTVIEDSADATGAMGQNFLAWTEHGRVNLNNALTHDPGPVVEDTTAPTISNVSASKPKNGPQFEVNWQTDEPATSTVSFTCCDDVSRTALVTDHREGMRGSKGATYEFWVSSTDAAGNTATDGPYYFTS